MERMATVLLGNHRGSDGICAFAREVLFRTAGEWVVDALPRGVCGPLFYLRADGDAAPTGTTGIPCGDAGRFQTLRGLDEVLAAEHVLVIAAPMPELTRRDYEGLLAVHETAGDDVTVLHCEDGAAGGGTRALPAAVFCGGVLRAALQGGAETLCDVISAAAGQDARMGVSYARPVTAVVSGMDAYLVQKKLMERIHFGHIAAGVQIFAPESTYIAPDAVIEAGASILPGTIIRGGCTVGAGAVIGPNSILEKAQIGAGTSVNCSQVYESSVGAHTTVGPFAYIRPGCAVGDHARIGDFVELKKSQIGDGTKVSHLTYIGDAEVGERVNFGCGTVVVNYDGYIKSKTEIGDDCFIGCNTNLVAPVKLGERVFTAAGTTVTTDVPAGALAVARVRQKTLEGWNDRRRAQHERTRD